MIFGALNGFRDFRGPLIVGYVNLLTLWLFLFDVLPGNRAQAKHDYPDLVHIADLVGPIGIAAGASFAAYILGGVIVRLASRTLAIRGDPIETTQSRVRRLLRSRFSLTHDAEMDDLEARLSDLVDYELSKIPDEETRESFVAMITRPRGRSFKWWRAKFETSPRVDAVELSPHERVRVEVKSGRIDERILAANSDLYSELSRLRSEAEFRAGLIPSLGLLAIAFAIRTPWPTWLLAALAIVWGNLLVLLLLETFELRSRVRTIALRAVVDELVSTPTLDQIKARSGGSLASGPVRESTSDPRKPDAGPSNDAARVAAD